MLKVLKKYLVTWEFLGMATWAFIATMVTCATHDSILGGLHSPFHVAVFAVITGLFAGIAVKYQLFGLLCGVAFLSIHAIIAIEVGKLRGGVWVGMGPDNLIANVITFTLLATPAMAELITWTRNKLA